MKLGSYRRAKGLEFTYVCLPRNDEYVKARSGSSETAPERQQLARRQLFVAMTRARDPTERSSRRPGRHRPTPKRVRGPTRLRGSGP
ncbi:hypothetical protein SVIO_054500 [Streptomyces violaceusniger]|uniref:UvrD-like helicase C-terminal domain-containing protein n=1 Tax=Streptomyces violaceusniger TaxID=68280 RepID=A0A4D4L871_STRVO|nr:hypothetical protein SVIO_054500 [Streptomyces violaceusniger]